MLNHLNKLQIKEEKRLNVVSKRIGLNSRSISSGIKEAIIFQDMLRIRRLHNTNRLLFNSRLQQMPIIQYKTSNKQQFHNKL